MTRCCPTADVLLATAHWAMKNALHWQFDVSFREGAVRNRKYNDAANIAVLRRRAVDALGRGTLKNSLPIS